MKGKRPGISQRLQQRQRRGDYVQKQSVENTFDEEVHKKYEENVKLLKRKTEMVT
jgi:hypothetical protein